MRSNYSFVVCLTEVWLTVNKCLEEVISGTVCVSFQVESNNVDRPAAAAAGLQQPALSLFWHCDDLLSKSH